MAASTSARSSRSTVGTSTEAYDYLRLLLARIGRVFCRQCGREVLRHTPQSVAAELSRLPAGARFMVAFPWSQVGSIDPRDLAARIVEEGFVRAIKGAQTVELANLAAQTPTESEAQTAEREDWHVVVDRLTAGSTADERLRDSLEMAFDKGRGQAVLYVEEEAAAAVDLGGASAEIDGRTRRRVKRNTRLVCDDCGIEYPAPDPRLFSFNSPLGCVPRVRRLWQHCRRPTWTW